MRSFAQSSLGQAGLAAGLSNGLEIPMIRNTWTGGPQPILPFSGR
jgi:hypothetical protein